MESDCVKNHVLYREYFFKNTNHFWGGGRKRTIFSQVSLDHSKESLWFQYCYLLGLCSENSVFMLRLTELSINWTLESQQENLETLLYSKPLESLDYFRGDNDECKSLESFLAQLLHSNLNLKHLKLCIVNDLVVTKHLYENLMSSNLKSCFLDIKGKIFVRDVDFFGSYFSTEHRPAVALPSLTVSIFNDYSKFEDIVSFLRCFPNLHNLYISWLSLPVLQSLFKYQVRIFCFHLLFSII